MIARFIALLAVFALAACGEPSKQDILEKAEGIDTKAELKDALGDPDNVNKAGPVETWTYNAENGQVTFLITGDSVALQTATDKASGSDN